MRMPRSLRRMLSDDSGAALPLVAVALFPTILLAAVMVDLGSAWIVRSQVQSAAEAAAAAAAPRCGQPSQAVAFAQMVASKDVYSGGYAQVSLSPVSVSCSASAPYTAYVRLTASVKPVLFGGLSGGIPAVSVSGSSRASWSPSTPLLGYSF